MCFTMIFTEKIQNLMKLYMNTLKDNNNELQLLFVYQTGSRKKGKGVIEKIDKMSKVTS